MNAIVGEGSKIKWGVIIAGAAIATGAILFAPVLAQRLPEMAGSVLSGLQSAASSIGDWISGLSTSTAAASGVAAAEQAATSAGEKVAEAVSSQAAKQLAGAGLIGGGIAYFMGSDKGKPFEPAFTAAADESFAMKEDMRRMQGLMVARAAASGNPQAQAMLSQQFGRA